MAKTNFLLGKGERLTTNIEGIQGGGPKHHPYSFDEAKERVSTMLSETTSQVDQLPEDACPDDQTVISITLNPEYIAKSYYPQQLLNDVGAQVVGSKPRKVLPLRKSKGREPEEEITTEFFVKTSRSALRNWSNNIISWDGTTNSQNGIKTIEKLEPIYPSEKVIGDLPDDKLGLFEVVLHMNELEAVTGMLSVFENFLKNREYSFQIGKRFFVKGLCFLELRVDVDSIYEIAEFSLVRLIRQMPNLRMYIPPTRNAEPIPFQTDLSRLTAVDNETKAAIFDAGIPPSHAITAWSTPYEFPDMEEASESYLSHGVGVTSAFLFGHISPTNDLPRPYCNIDHYRVVDESSETDNNDDLYDVLARIENVLQNGEYDFINLSLGPELPIDDNDVHSWTAVLDDLLERTDTLATIAVGNNGEKNYLEGFDRIQVPADCVNAISVGACDSPHEEWNRAPYSAIGPGRSPGLIKPDLMEFGGILERPYLVFSPDNTPSITQQIGTSFSAPSVLRLAAGVRAHFGDNLSNLAIKTLLIHTSETNEQSMTEIGWGRVARNLEEIVVCEDNEIRVVYQGNISPSKYIRADIPLPEEDLEGMVDISATICFASQTDPHHPSNYTQAGLEITFRPDATRFSRPKQVHPDSQTFFSKSPAGISSETELRRDGMKWENCLHAKKRKNGKTLYKPCFDIHYNARLESRDFRPNSVLNYALVITIKAKKDVDLYNQIVREYATRLEAIQPVLEIPIQN